MKSWILCITYHIQLSMWKTFSRFQLTRVSCTWAVTCDFQQCGVLTRVDSDQSVQPHFKLRSSKWFSGSSLTVIETQATSKGSDQTVCMRRLVWGFAGRTFHIVGNLMSRLTYTCMRIYVAYFLWCACIFILRLNHQNIHTHTWTQEG